MKNEIYDVVVIGGGPAGYKTAELLAKKKKKIALIEKEFLGGVCLNYGCIPFKGYLYSSGLLSDVNKGIKEGIISSAGISVEQIVLYEKKERVTEALRTSIKKTLSSMDVFVIEGTAKLKNESVNGITLDVNGTEITGSNLVIAIGSEERQIDVLPENSSLNILGSRNLLELKEIPDCIDILGGGNIGIEAASFFSEVGCKARIIESASHIGGNIDEEIGEALQTILYKKGIEVHTDVQLMKIENNSLICVEKDRQPVEFKTNDLLIAIGRKPKIDPELFEKLGINYSSRGIVIDEHCKTSNDRVYACGDVTGKLMLAHVAYRQAQLVAESICGDEETELIDYSIVPRVIYANPEVLSIGLTEFDCQKKNLEYKTCTLPMTYSGKYFAEKGKDGAKAKIIVDGNEQIIGFHMIGEGASEISLAAELMLKFHMTVNEIKHLIFPHPTYGEIIGNLVEQIES